MHVRVGHRRNIGQDIAALCAYLNWIEITHFWRSFRILGRTNEFERPEVVSDTRIPTDRGVSWERWKNEEKEDGTNTHMYTHQGCKQLLHIPRNFASSPPIRSPQQQFYGMLSTFQRSLPTPQALRGGRFMPASVRGKPTSAPQFLSIRKGFQIKKQETGVENS